MILLRKNGFTMVELVMTIVVSTIIAIPLALMVREHVISLNDIQDDSMAIELARYDVERLKNTAYASLSIGTTTLSNYQSYPYDVRRTITYRLGTSGSAESMKKIQVDVRKAGSSTNVYSLFDYVAKNITIVNP